MAVAVDDALLLLAVGRLVRTAGWRVGVIVDTTADPLAMGVGSLTSFPLAVAEEPPTARCARLACRMALLSSTASFPGVFCVLDTGLLAEGTFWSETEAAEAVTPFEDIFATRSQSARTRGGRLRGARTGFS